MLEKLDRVRQILKVHNRKITSPLFMPLMGFALTLYQPSLVEDSGHAWAECEQMGRYIGRPSSHFIRPK